MLLVVEVYLGWSVCVRSIGIGPVKAALIRISKVRSIGVMGLMTGTKIFTILILVTLTTFVYCHMDGTVVVLQEPFSLFLVIRVQGL